MKPNAPDHAPHAAHDVADHDQEARLDAWLSTSIPPPPPAALRAAILAAARPAPVPPRWRERMLAFWQEIGGARLAAPAFALALLAGIGLGSGLSSHIATDDGADDLLTLALIDDDYLALAP